MDSAPEPKPEMPLQCGTCKAATAPGAAFCMQCGAVLDQSHAAASPAVQAQDSIAANPAKKPELTALSWLKIVVVLGLALLATFVGERDAPGAEQVGYYFGILLIPF